MSALQRAALRASTYLSVALPLVYLSSLRFASYVNVNYIYFHSTLTFSKLSCPLSLPPRDSGKDYLTFN